MAEDPYKVLGVARDAPDEEIRRAYRKLAKQLHPDLNPSNRAASEEKFKKVSAAMVPLGKQTVLLDEVGGHIPQWDKLVDRQTSIDVRGLVLRLALVALGIAVLLAHRSSGDKLAGSGTAVIQTATDIGQSAEPH